MSKITDLSAKASDSRDALLASERAQIKAHDLATAADQAVNDALLAYHTDRSALQAALTDPTPDEVSPPAPAPVPTPQPDPASPAPAAPAPNA